jgi:hypothetical protein
MIFIVVLASLFSTVIFKSDYTFNLKFNNDDMAFFNNETLYFSGPTKINFIGKGYTLKLNGKKIDYSTSLNKDGVYNLKISKYFKHYSLTVTINSKADFYLVDANGKEIHNYLSNTKAFKIVKINTKSTLYLNNNSYIENTLVNKFGDYVVSTKESRYDINILEKK